MASILSPLLSRRLGTSLSRLPLRQPALRARPTTAAAAFFRPLLARPLSSRILAATTTGTKLPFFKENTIRVLRPRNYASAANASPVKSSFFPQHTAKPVAYWLFFSASLVFGIVILGGLTRLTESGLSITEWKPITGVIPPLSQADWEAEFEKYKDSPEFVKLNSRMTLDEFKFIYNMEWAHRVLGRVIGVAFVLPALAFVASKKVSARRAGFLGLIGLGIGFQGFLGWWMVKSGLKHEDFEAPESIPRVSPYRLTAHLGVAFVVYCAMLWNGVMILKENKLLKEGIKTDLSAFKNPIFRSTRNKVALLTLMIFTTAMSGALVAGLDAGKIYNEFPMMGKGLTPPASELMSDFYCQREDKSDLVWRNLFENPSTVQLEHRILAITTFTALVTFAILARRPQTRAVLNKQQMKGIQGMMHVGGLQVLLGITTLIYMVPTHLAATHQANALALLSMALIALSRFSVPTIQRSLADSQKTFDSNITDSSPSPLSTPIPAASQILNSKPIGMGSLPSFDTLPKGTFEAIGSTLKGMSEKDFQESLKGIKKLAEMQTGKSIGEVEMMALEGMLNKLRQGEAAGKAVDEAKSGEPEVKPKPLRRMQK